jgi:NAD-dependent DNA ligase
MPPSPTNHTTFDPWNTASTGHQRAENPYSSTTSWRETRQAKLAIQFASSSGDCTPTTKTDSGSGNGGEWKWLSAAEAQRNQLGCRDIRTMMGRSKKRPSASASASTIDEDDAVKCKKAKTEILCQTPESKPESNPGNKPQVEDKDRVRKILKGTTIYINGSTMPHISDHKLKSLLVSHGAEIAIALSRKTVTHVIIGKPNGGPGSRAGAGGGLAAGKLQREISRGGWRGVKVVGVEW